MFRLLTTTAIATILCTSILAQKSGNSVLSYQPPDRLWLAGRYDGDRIVVYFDKVHFGEDVSTKGRKIPPPVADLFFDPVELPPTYIARFQQKPSAEHFALGNQYDLMLGNGTIATVKLTTLVGCQTDEEVGNDSFIGALATVDRRDALLFTQPYYALRRHQIPASDAGRGPKSPAEYLQHAGLVNDPIPFSVESHIADLLNQRMNAEATAAEQRMSVGAEPALAIQAFNVADGTRRYYVRAVWKSGKETQRQLPYSLAAWIVAQPALHVLAVEHRTSGYDDLGLAKLRNVVDLGLGRTGIIVEMNWDERRELILADYRDGASIGKMQIFQSIGVGE